MDVEKVIKELSQKYPGKKIIKNPEENPTEIICEIDPASKHSEYSIAIAVIDKSSPHYHKETTEIYEALTGELILNKDGQDYKLKEGDKLTIKPGEIHSAIGNETWAKVYSKPGWTLQDHILVQDTKDYKICVAAVIENNGKVLIGKARESKVFITNGWHLPGGKLQEDESGEEAIVREIKEETGIDIKVKEFLEEKVLPNVKTKAKWYLCSAITNDLRASDDLIEAKFVPKSEVVKICDPQAISHWPLKVINYFK